MKVRNISVYECGVCGCCYNTGAAAKRCETRHFKLTGTPKVANYYYEEPQEWPETIIVEGVNGHGTHERVVYELASIPKCEANVQQHAYLDDYYASNADDPSEEYIPIDDGEEDEGDPVPF